MLNVIIHNDTNIVLARLINKLERESIEFDQVKLWPNHFTLTIPHADDRARFERVLDSLDSIKVYSSVDTMFIVRYASWETE